MIADFSKAGKYKGREWLKLEEKINNNPKSFTKFRASHPDAGWSEVKRGYLYHRGRAVYRGRFHDFEFSDHKFAMTLTYFNNQRRVLKPFKIRRF